MASVNTVPYLVLLAVCVGLSISGPVMRASLGPIRRMGSNKPATSPNILPLARNKPGKSPVDDGHHSSPLVAPDSQLRKQQIALITAYIKRNKISEAERIFDDELQQPVSLSADSDRMIRQLFLDAYDNDINNVDKLLKFEMSRIDQFSVGYETLYEGMVKNKQLNTPQVVHLASLAEYLTGLSSEFPKVPRRYKDRFERVKLGTEEPMQKMIAQWAEKIRQVDYQFIVDYLGELPTASFVVKQLIPAVYANRAENIDKVLDFIRDIPSISATITGIDELHTIVEDHQPGHFNNNPKSLHNIALGYIVEETMSFADYPYIPHEDRDKLEAVRDAIWPKKIVGELVQQSSEEQVDDVIKPSSSTTTPSSPTTTMAATTTTDKGKSNNVGQKI